MDLSSVYFGAVMTNAVVIILVHIFWFTYMFILVEYTYESRIVGQSVCVGSFDRWCQFSKVVVPFYTLS